MLSQRGRGEGARLRVQLVHDTGLNAQIHWNTHWRNSQPMSRRSHLQLDRDSLLCVESRSSVIVIAILSSQWSFSSRPIIQITR